MDQNFIEQNSPLNQGVNALFSNLENFTQNEGLIGKPVTYEDKTFIPVVSVTLGYGGGNTASKNQQGGASSNTGTGTDTKMAGGALGLGARLNTEAVIVIDKGNVSMMHLGASANVNQFMSKIPEVLMGMNMNKGNQQGQQAQQTNQYQSTEQ